MKKQEIERIKVLMDKLQKYRVKCKCGHVLTMVSKKHDICTWCGRKVYRSKKDEFEDKISKEIKIHH